MIKRIIIFLQYIYSTKESANNIRQTRHILRNVWGFNGRDYEECRLLGYKNPVRTSQETPHISATESSQLMLCKSWGSNGGDYEECSFLGYKKPVRTSQETHHVSAKALSQLMLSKILGFHGGDSEECSFLGYKKTSSYFTGDTSRLR
jgi:hypothetical protein